MIYDRLKKMDKKERKAVPKYQDGEGMSPKMIKAREHLGRVERVASFHKWDGENIKNLRETKAIRSLGGFPRSYLEFQTSQLIIFKRVKFSIKSSFS